MARQRFYDDRWMPVEEAERLKAERNASDKRSDVPFPMIIADRVEYQSQITGEMITGRRQHREHLQQHGCIEVGNEMPTFKQPVFPKDDIKSDIKTAIEQCEAGYIPPDTPIGSVGDDGKIVETPDLEPIVLSSDVKNGDVVRSDIVARDTPKIIMP